MPRHKFVSPEDEGEAYNSHPLPIGCGQTISQPFIVAFMTELLRPGSSDKILEIGTGSGYQAAILSELVAEVFTIEVIPELSEQAAKRLQGYKNVFVRTGDGANGWPEKALFDGIIVTASSETIPLKLLDQLKPHGRLVIPLGRKRETLKCLHLLLKLLEEVF